MVLESNEPFMRQIVVDMAYKAIGVFEEIRS
jgi:hypothetical protein